MHSTIWKTQDKRSESSQAAVPDLNMSGDDCSVSLGIERGAARISIDDSPSPTRADHERTPSRYPMSLRSHSGHDVPPFSWFLADSLRLLPSSMTDSSPAEYGSEATTDILDPSQFQDSISEPYGPARNLDSPRGPFLSLPTTPERNASRVWAFHNPMEPDFAIWEDPTYRQSPLRLPPMSYPDAGEEKENTYATVSDYDTSDGEESERQRIDWARVQVGPHDVFGLPVDSPFGPVLGDLPVGRHAGDTFSRAVHTATERNVQPQMRVMMLDEGEEEDWDDSLSMPRFGSSRGWRMSSCGALSIESTMTATSPCEMQMSRAKLISFLRHGVLPSTNVIKAAIPTLWRRIS